MTTFTCRWKSEHFKRWNIKPESLNNDDVFQSGSARCQTVGFISGPTVGGIIGIVDRHRVDSNVDKSDENFHLLARLRCCRFLGRLIKAVVPHDDVAHRRKLQNTFLRYHQWVNEHVSLNRQLMFLFVLSVPEKTLAALIPVEQIIAWKWAIVLAFAVPECGTLLRSLRLWFFKSIKSFTWKEFGLVFVFETLHVIGLCLLAFKILPELDVIQGAMLTNCLCLVPSILCKKNFFPFNSCDLNLSLHIFRHVVSLTRRA